MSSWPETRIRYLADINPRVPEKLLAEPTAEVSFLPMEAIGEGGAPHNLERTRPVAEVRNGYSYFADGDVVFAKVTPCFENGKGGVVQGLQRGAGFGTTELTVLRPREGVDARFLNYLLQQAEFRQAGVSSMLGAGGLKRIPDDFVRDFKVPCPSPSEQERIANFLDEQTARIDALIAEKEKLLTGVMEYFQSRLGTAVTQGVPGRGALEERRREGFDAVRTDWCLVPLKHLARASGGLTPAKDNLAYWDGDIPWVTPKDMKRFVIDDSQEHVTEAALSETSLRLHEPNAVLVVVRGMILAHTFPVALNVVPVTINQDMKALRVSGRVTPKYLAWMLRGLQPLMLSLTEESAHGTKALRTDQWANQRVPLPSPTEQDELVVLLEEWSRETEELTAHLRVHIQRLREYRSSLISSAVTGQLDLGAFEAETRKAA